MANNLSCSEIERIAKLVKELAGVQQVLGNILIYGYDGINPARTDGLNNRQLLERELGDVYSVGSLMAKKGDIDVSRIREYKEIKLRKLKNWTSE